MRNISPVLKTIIFAGLFAVPFIPFLVSSSFFFPFITTKAFVWRIIIEVVFAAWVILALVDREYRPKKSPILYAVLAFLAVIGLSSFFGVDPARSFWSNFERMEGFISLLHLGAFFLVISSVFREIDPAGKQASNGASWNRWWNTSLVASALMVFYVIFQLLGAAEIHQGGVRVDGTFGNASYLAVYMLIHIFIAILMLWRSRKDFALRSIYGLLIFGQAFVLYHTATRGAILGLLVGLLIVAVLNIRNLEGKQASNGAGREDAWIRKLSIGFLLSVVAIASGFFFLRNSSFVQNSPVLERFADISTEELKGGGRSFVWPMAIEGFKERSLFGWGQENFMYVFQKYYDPGMYQLEPWFDRAHNIFLDWMVAGGILGLLAYVSLYFTFLYLVWKRDANLSHAEKSVLTGLLAAYFFHNLFVFDHLVSYILFFSLLAYIHSRQEALLPAHGQRSGVKGSGGAFHRPTALPIAIPAVAILLILSLYFVNVKPITANATLIEALKAVQLNEPSQAIANFKKAYDISGFGRSEVVEHASNNLEAIISSDLSNAEKNEFLDFMNGVVKKNAEDNPNLARAQMVAGSFFFKTSLPDEAIKYLSRAEELSPGKQPIKFEIAEAYIYKGDYNRALEVARRAYELDPTYAEAQFTYAVTAIYAGDRELENILRDRIYDGDAELERKAKIAGGMVDLERWVESDLIVSAYLKVGRTAEAMILLKRRIETDPAEIQNYISLVSVHIESGNKAAAIQTLNELGAALPEYKAQAEEYIRQIQAGEI